MPDRPSSAMKRRSLTIEARLLHTSLHPVETRLEAGLSHLVVVEAGQLTLDRDGHSHQLRPPQIIWLPPGPATRLRMGAGGRAAHLGLNEVGLAHALPTGALNIRLRGLLTQALLLSLPDPDRSEILRHLEVIAAETRSPAPGTEVIMAGLASVILIRLWRAGQGGALGSSAQPQPMLDRFVLLVAQHRREHWTVGDYAAAIGTTRERLGRIVQQATGLSPRAFIHREVMADARDLLGNSRLQVAEIAFRLGFQDPAYFNRFFTRNEGLSPGRFRRRSPARTARDDASYAAWP